MFTRHHLSALSLRQHRQHEVKSRNGFDIYTTYSSRRYPLGPHNVHLCPILHPIHKTPRMRMFIAIPRLSVSTRGMLFFSRISTIGPPSPWTLLSNLTPSHIPNNPPPPPPPPCLIAASPCIFSDTFILISKNLLTHLSRQTDSPLLSSPSRYSGGIHLEVQDCCNLCVQNGLVMWDLGCGGGKGYRLNISLIISTSVSALAIFSAEES